MSYQTDREHFELHAKADPSIACSYNHQRCYFTVDSARLKRLKNSNFDIAEDITDIQERLDDFQNISKSLVPMDEPTTNELAEFKLYAYYGMTILLSYVQRNIFYREFVLKLLNQIHKDRQLLASIVASTLIYQSESIKTTSQDVELYLSVRNECDTAMYISVDMTLLPKVVFPHISLWEECGLGWLLGEYVCSGCSRMHSTPWIRRYCR